MLSFLSLHPPRTKVAHLDVITFDDGRSSVEFKPPSDRYLVINRWPPARTASDAVPGQAKCALSPPPHWHYYQKETFHILSGTAKFMLEGEQILLRAGEVIEIPAGVFHTFCNASLTEEMVVEFMLEPGTRERDEGFFSKFNYSVRYLH
jgi:mannose-6-phosphate isomerase-like protein (cupin superfamily)